MKQPFYIVKLEVQFACTTCGQIQFLVFDKPKSREQIERRVAKESRKKCRHPHDND